MNSLNSLPIVAMSIPQGIIICIVAAGVVIMFGVFFYLLYLLMYKPELKAELNEAAKKFRVEKKRILTEKKIAEEEIRVSSKEIDEKTEKVHKLNSEAEKMRLELMRQGLKEIEAEKLSKMTLEQLLVLKGKEKMDLSGNFVINAITRKVLIDSDFKRRDDVEDFKVPKNITKEVTLPIIEKHLDTMFDAIKTIKGSTMTYKIQKRAFVMFNKNEDMFQIKVKCGTYYGQRLAQLYPKFFKRASFPSGMLWFDIAFDDKDCSLELVKLLITISHNIAKAGY